MSIRRSPIDENPSFKFSSISLQTPEYKVELLIQVSSGHSSRLGCLRRLMDSSGVKSRGCEAHFPTPISGALQIQNWLPMIDVSYIFALFKRCRYKTMLQQSTLSLRLPSPNSTVVNLPYSIVILPLYRPHVQRAHDGEI